MFINKFPLEITTFEAGDPEIIMQFPAVLSLFKTTEYPELVVARKSLVDTNATFP